MMITGHLPDAATGALEITALEGFGGGGATSLFKEAIRESQRHFNGGIYLQSLDTSFAFYQKLQPTWVHGHEFFWSAQDAAKLLK